MKVLAKGHASCLSAGFRYTPAASTDIAKTFARIRREMKAAATPAPAAPAAGPVAAPRPKLRLRAIIGDR